jgi:hypothetical protein
MLIKENQLRIIIRKIILKEAVNQFNDPNEAQLEIEKYESFAKTLSLIISKIYKRIDKEHDESSNSDASNNVAFRIHNALLSGNFTSYNEIQHTINYMLGYLLAYRFKKDYGMSVIEIFKNWGLKNKTYLKDRSFQEEMQRRGKNTFSLEDYKKLLLEMVNVFRKSSKIKNNLPDEKILQALNKYIENNLSKINAALVNQ